MANRPIDFSQNVDKTVEVLVWLANEQPGIDFYHVVKVLYFADKRHLLLHGRPVLGDTYIKMSQGPVPSLAYDLLKRNRGLPVEVLQQISEALELTQDDQPCIAARRDANTDLLSGSDINCLRESLEQYGLMGFSELWKLSHKERAWLEADTNQAMDYALMIDEDVPNRTVLVEQLREDAAYIVF